MAGDSEESILALVPNWLGDVAMCTPALRAIYRRYGAFTVAGVPAACALLNGLPWFREIVPFPARASLPSLLRTALRLRPLARDLAIVFPHSFRAAMLARLAGARRRVGYACNGRSFMLTERIEFQREDGKRVPIYTAEEYLRLAAMLGGEDDGQGLELRAEPEWVARIKSLFTGRGPRVGLAPGAAFGPSKRWPVERFAAVADALDNDLHAECVLLTGPGEEAIEARFLAAAKTPVVRLEGPGSVERLKAVVSQLELLIGNDSGPRHVAVAFHVPVVCIMGPTSPRYSEGPYERGRVLRIDVDCRP
ncbi:MAG: glycosyltransferase family 9 protein, partial [Candidatus Hydrogenedentes bacterium]|nr:glycosyltransferase family 9 protein [Candidatus Hydrogenedentota bacterium]